MRLYFNNSMKLTKFVLRREWISTGIWILVLLLFAIAVPIIYAAEYADGSLDYLAGVMQNPAITAIAGPVFGPGNTVAAMYATDMTLFTIIAVAIMNIFLVVRNTRTDEELGRYEVVRSLPVGRLANIHSTMIIALCVNIVIALTHGIVLGALGIESITWFGGFTFGAMLGVSGLFFAAVAVLCAQLLSSSASAKGYAFIFLLAGYLVRAIGDVSNETLSYFSPLGLIMRTKVFYENNWWLIGIIFILAVGITALAYRLNVARDIEQGFIPERPGPASASKFLRTSFGLTWRLTRNTLIAWGVGMFIFGGTFGLIMGDIEYFVAEIDFLVQLMPDSPDYSMTELFGTVINAMIALFCAVPVLVLSLKMRGEEKKHRTEYILGMPCSRKKYLAGFVVIASATCILMPFIAALGMWALSIPMLVVPISFANLLRAVMVYVPALWIMLGVAICLIGLWPKGTVIAWAYFALVFVVSFFGEILNIPGWALNLSPFEFVPQLPMDEVNMLTMLIMIGVGAALTGVGFLAYSKRDMVD